MHFSGILFKTIVCKTKHFVTQFLFFYFKTLFLKLFNLFFKKTRMHLNSLLKLSLQKASFKVWMHFSNILFKTIVFKTKHSVTQCLKLCPLFKVSQTSCLKLWCSKLCICLNFSNILFQTIVFKTMYSTTQCLKHWFKVFKHPC